MRSSKLFFIAAILFTIPALAQVKLPRLIRDSMVLQRDTKIRIWGWASPGEKISIAFNNKKIKTTAGKDGTWYSYLPAMKAGGPFEMKIDASNHIKIRDILVGDVWICSGQSNMVHQMVLHRERYENEIVNAKYPAIRHFWISTMTDLNQPHVDLPSGFWKSANPEDVLQFSAVAYFFAKDLYEKYHVPIGLINASVGGTPVEAWTSEEGLKEFPSVYSTITKNKDTGYVNTTNRMGATSLSRRQPIEDMGLQSSVKWFDSKLCS
jgi:sialate O-acetylesterase